MPRFRIASCAADTCPLPPSTISRSGIAPNDSSYSGDPSSGAPLSASFSAPSFPATCLTARTAASAPPASSRSRSAPATPLMRNRRYSAGFWGPVFEHDHRADGGRALDVRDVVALDALWQRRQVRARPAAAAAPRSFLPLSASQLRPRLLQRLPRVVHRPLHELRFSPRVGAARPHRTCRAAPRATARSGSRSVDLDRQQHACAARTAPIRRTARRSSQHDSASVSSAVPSSWKLSRPMTLAPCARRTPARTPPAPRAPGRKRPCPCGREPPSPGAPSCARSPAPGRAGGPRARTPASRTPPALRVAGPA